MARSKKNFNATTDIILVILAIPILGSIVGVAFSAMGTDNGILAGIVFIGIGAIIYIKELLKLSKNFKISEKNKYNIDKVKEYFGTPTTVTADEQNTYYRFEDKVFFVKRGHFFTTDKNGNVTKYETETF